MLRPELLKLGGHSCFGNYRTIFQQMYCTEPIYDVMKRRVHFDQAPTLDDCAHVCYGGESKYVYRESYWRQDRAERIPYIERAIKHPAKIHPKRNHPGRQIYLLYLGAENSTQENEFFCLIVDVISSSAVAFITAYPIDRRTYSDYESVGPCIYPVTPKKKNKKRGGKKKRDGKNGVEENGDEEN